MTTPAGAASTDYLGMSDDDFLKVNPATVPADTMSAEDIERQAREKAAKDREAEEAAEAEAAKAAENAGAADEGGNKEEENKEKNPDGTADANDDPDGAKAAAAAAAKNGTADADDPAKAKELADKAKAEADNIAAGKNPDGSEKTAEQKAADEKAKTDAEKEAAKAAKPAENAEKKDAQKPVDFQKFYEQVMAPFKANGKEFTLKSADEAIRLMQMGAGMGKKLAAIQPHLKTLRMLEKNDLLDPAKLGFLIDINSKNPEAIKKLIKDAGIDPLDLDIKDNVDYKPGNHDVSDQEVALQSALSEMQSDASGRETLVEINRSWDAESKQALWDNPELLGIIKIQRENKIYEKIATEIERQKMLGTLPQTTSFLKAYKMVGDQLFPPAQSTPVQQIQTQPGGTQQQQVIATRTETPKAPVKDGEKAAAAAPTKEKPARKPGPTINPLAMADDDFLKQFGDRFR